MHRQLKAQPLWRLHKLSVQDSRFFPTHPTPQPIQFNANLGGRGRLSGSDSGILLRAAERTGVTLTFVANQLVRIPPFKNVRSIQVPGGFDVADDEIVKRCEAGDLVITSDLPLAAEVIDKGATALSPRGELLTKDNIRPQLNMRDFLETMRASGEHTAGPPPLDKNDRMKFANQLDRLLARR